MKRIVVHGSEQNCQVAVMENGRLVEFYAERSSERGRAGNIYKGRVVNVLAGMQAAFVDIGMEKNAFLYIDDLLPAHLEKQPAEKPSILELVKKGQDIVVQVKKEPIGTKGARVTTHYALPGRWLVYMPHADYVAVSKKVEPDKEKARLKEIGDALRRNGEGLILRTVAGGETADALHNDLVQLRESWERLERAGRISQPPALLYQDAGMLERMIRDLFTNQVDELLIDDEAMWREAERLVAQMAPAISGRLKRHGGNEPIFQSYNVEEELELAFRRKIWLKSGGYLVVDQTEALTVIDVNTGKFTGSSGLAETVFTTNREAAEEIARLLRLRDIGGIVVVDFIDMNEERERKAISDELEYHAKGDRAKPNVVGWTKLGLLELTRKKVRQTVDDMFYEHCPQCAGTGKLLRSRK